MVFKGSVTSVGCSLQPAEALSPSAQGYIQYRIAGEPHRLDVDTLNEKLRLRGAARMRLLMRPDEAYGMIFDFDGPPLPPSAAAMLSQPACQPHVS